MASSHADVEAAQRPPAPVMGEGVLFPPAMMEPSPPGAAHSAFPPSTCRHAAEIISILARAAEAAAMPLSRRRFVGQLRAAPAPGDDVFGVMPGADRLQIVVPLVPIFVENYRPSSTMRRKNSVHKERVAALLTDPGVARSVVAALGAKYRRQPARHRFHGKRLVGQSRSCFAPPPADASQQRLQGGIGHGADIPGGPVTTSSGTAPQFIKAGI